MAETGIETENLLCAIACVRRRLLGVSEEVHLAIAMMVGFEAALCGGNETSGVEVRRFVLLKTDEKSAMVGRVEAAMGARVP